MSSADFLITQAYKKNGVLSVAVPRNPEAIVDGLVELNGMLQMWESQGIEIGTVTVENVQDEVGEPPDCTIPIIDNLAMGTAAMFQAPIPQTLSDSAREGYEWVKSLYQVTDIPEKQVSSTMPVGSGNERGINRRVFAGRNRRISN